MAIQSFSYQIDLLLTKYAQCWTNFYKKGQIFCRKEKKHSPGIYPLFATMSDPLTLNLQFLV